MQLLGQDPVAADLARPHDLLAPGDLAQDLARGLRRDAAEGALQEAAHVAALRLLRHEHERPQLDAVGVRLDLDRFLGQLARRAGEAQGLVPRSLAGVATLGRADGPHVVDRGVGVRERRVLDVAVDEALPLLPVRDDLQLHAGPVLQGPLLERLVVGHHRLVLARVDLDVEDVGLLALAHPARDADRLAGGDLAVHRRRGDPDALLSTASA